MDNNVNNDNKPRYYIHKYGGIYRFICDATATDDSKTPVVVYAHHFPFPEKVYVRNKSEFDMSFSPVDAARVDIIMAQPRENVMSVINKRKGALVNISTNTDAFIADVKQRESEILQDLNGAELSVILSTTNMINQLHDAFLNKIKSVVTRVTR